MTVTMTQAVAGSTVIEIACSTNFRVNPQQGGTVKTDQGADIYTVSQQTVTVIGTDPLTIYQGKKVKFWLPQNRLLPLLKTPDLTVLASAFQGPSEDLQWFDRFVVTLPDRT